MLDPLNSTQNTTLARLNTLGSMIVAFGTTADDAWRAAFLNATATAWMRFRWTRWKRLSGIARAPWANPEAVVRTF